jgi:hypothetical protein
MAETAGITDPCSFERLVEGGFAVLEVIFETRWNDPFPPDSEMQSRRSGLRTPTGRLVGTLTGTCLEVR